MGHEHNHHDDENDDDENDDDFTPWTQDGAEKVRTEARKAAAALIAYADALAELTDGDFAERAKNEERLLQTLLRFSDAEFAFTGSGGALGLLHEYADDDEEEDDAADSGPVAGLSVLQRTDYRVTDEATVIEAGRSAYLEVWPDETAQDAANDVTTLGRALYQVAHAAGTWTVLDKADGLEVTGRVIVLVDAEQTLGSETDDWPEDVFAHDEDKILYQQEDVYLR